MTTATAAAAPPFMLCPINAIVPSPTNPRKTFNEAALKELTASVKDHGVVQPILVRVIKDGKYELVAGERRWRASKAAGLSEIPATVRELSDGQVLEIQVIENLQRDDLHPLEEAEGYETLMKSAPDGKRFTVDEIAARVNKSRAYVYAKLKLLALCPEARKAALEGKISESIALLVARIPGAELQKQALKEITSWGDGMSYRQAADYVQRRYMLRLEDAVFDRGDAELLKAAGACTTCPKRTGNQKELFGDVKSADVCTDPGCFEKKTEAHGVRVIAIAKKEGKPVLAPAEAKKVFGRERWSELNSYTDPEKKVFIKGDYTSYKKLLGKDLPPQVLAVNPHTNQPVSLLKNEDLKAALAAKGINLNANMRAAKGINLNANMRAAGKTPQQKAAEQKKKLEAEIRREIYLAARAKAGTDGLVPEDVRLCASAFWDRLWHDYKKIIAPLWIADAPPAPDAKGKKAPRVDKIAALTDRVETMTGPELIQLLLDCSLASGLAGSENNYYGKTKANDIDALAVRHGVDVAGIRARLTEEWKANQKHTPKKLAKKAKS